jgi:putative transposase
VANSGAIPWPARTVCGTDRRRGKQHFTNTHVKRWKEHRHETGYGHLYQGRYKSFPAETDDYFYHVLRYVERNALRANLAERAEQWQWSSLGRPPREDPAFPMLAAWPLPRPSNWLELVNQPQSEAELAALRRCANRGTPYGNADTVEHTAKQLGLQSTIRPRGHPTDRP